MKEEIRRILDMNKTGKITDDQATELIAALGDRTPGFTEEPEHKNSGATEVHNRTVLSKVDQVSGSDFSFADNAINVSSVTDLKLRKSHIRDNSINALARTLGTPWPFVAGS